MATDPAFAPIDSTDFYAQLARSSDVRTDLRIVGSALPSASVVEIAKAAAAADRGRVDAVITKEVAQSRASWSGQICAPFWRLLTSGEPFPRSAWYDTVAERCLMLATEGRSPAHDATFRHVAEAAALLAQQQERVLEHALVEGNDATVNHLLHRYPALLDVLDGWKGRFADGSEEECLRRRATYTFFYEPYDALSNPPVAKPDTVDRHGPGHRAVPDGGG